MMIVEDRFSSIASLQLVINREQQLTADYELLPNQLSSLKHLASIVHRQLCEVRVTATDLVLFFEKIESLKCDQDMMAPLLTELKKELWSVLQTSD